MFVEIETARLILRPLREEDRQSMIALHTDPRTTRFESNPPDAAQVSLLVDSWLADWTEHGYGYCTVTSRLNPDVIGLAGIRARDVRGEGVLNLAYRFSPEVWGRGYAVEAAKAVVDWRDRNLPWIPLVANVNVENERSGRVAERVGFTEYTEEFYEGALSHLYRLEANHSD
ncbi:GNAT family N-acetyltransferase [Rhodococcus sp. BP22]|uniref:GNAT family N-acetyltransferase n=1 Tax=Rhodococcus sp. BP22 TaxID=2758566 RepID=UPI0016441283|nr:GNAT family N-acetyltransferase [Rhodococcus sp. BP22]